MYNIILDSLPSEYEGYLIRTSFRIGIQLCLLFKDVDYTEEEKLAIALNLLYGNGVPNDLDLALSGIQWFLSCGTVEENKSSDSKELFYWDYDSSRLYSSFMVSYGIDLTRCDLHWFEFVSLIGSLTKDSAFNSAIEVRNYDLSELKGKSRTKMQKLKRDLTPPVQLTAEEQEAIDKFEALLNTGDVNG